jgi:hypothetical protein
MESILTHLEEQNVELLPGRATLCGWGGCGGGWGGWGGWGWGSVGVGTVVANNQAIALFGSAATATQVINQNVGW